MRCCQSHPPNTVRSAASRSARRARCHPFPAQEGDHGLVSQTPRRFGARYAAVRTGRGGPDQGLDVCAPDASVYGAICRIGGNNGWSMSWLWRIRSWLDHLAGDPGLRRGRRDPNRLRFGDALNFWRVVAIQSNRHLSLRAEMRLPGAAILDFRISRQIAKGPGVSEEMLFALRSVERSSECSVF